MAINLLIPRIEWNDIAIEATRTLDSETLTGISSTTALKIGMIINGPGIPEGTRIVNKTTTTVELSQKATSGGLGTHTAFQRFDFVYPATKDSEDQLKVDNKVTTSLTGEEQTQTNFIKGIRDLEFWFITDEQRTFLLNDFFLAWACLGKKFRYFDDQDDAGNKIYSLEKFDPKLARQIKKHPKFLYLLSFSITRKVL